MLQRIDAMYKEDATETGAGANFASKKKNATVVHPPAQQDSDGMDLVALHVEGVGAGPSEEAKRMQTNSQRLFRQAAGVFGLSRLTPKRVTGRNCILLGHRAGGSGIRTVCRSLLSLALLMSLVAVTILIYLPVCVLNRGAQDLQVLHLQPLHHSLQTLQTLAVVGEKKNQNQNKCLKKNMYLKKKLHPTYNHTCTHI